MAEHNKGHGHGNAGAPFTQSPGTGKGSAWPKGENIPNSVPKEWKSGKGGGGHKPK